MILAEPRPYESRHKAELAVATVAVIVQLLPINETHEKPATTQMTL